MKKSRILITGAGGFIGASLTRTLLSENNEVHIILREKNHTWRLDDILPELSVHHLDMLDKKKLKTLTEKIQPEYIFHLAAHGAYSSQNNVEEMINTNIVSLANLLEATGNIPYKAFINTGSSSEYGFKKKAMKETDFLEPDSFYAATKASATLFGQVFAKKYNKPVITFRLFSVFGPFEDPSRFIPTAMCAALTKSPLGITPGIVKRDFIYVKDVVKAYIAIMKKKILPGDIVNIGTGKQTSNEAIARLIKKINNNNLAIHKGAFPQRSWDTNYWVANMQHTKTALSWYPKYSLEKGLEETYQWFKNNGIKYQKIYGKI